MISFSIARIISTVRFFSLKVGMMVTSFRRVPINYVGHAEKWDELMIDGDVMEKNCLLRYKRNGRVLAVASIYRDVESLKAEVAMERDTA